MPVPVKGGNIASSRMLRSTTPVGVYCILNTLNGKRYVGSTSKLGFKTRWADHKRRLRRNKHHSNHLQYAWNNYSEVCFEFIILEVCAIDTCITKEQFWIDKYNSANRNYGYNICPKAGSPLGYKHTEEAKLKIATSLAGRTRTDTHKYNLFKSLKGHKRSEESKAKQSQSRIGMVFTEEHRANISKGVRARVHYNKMVGL